MKTLFSAGAFAGALLLSTSALAQEDHSHHNHHAGMSMSGNHETGHIHCLANLSLAVSSNSAVVEELSYSWQHAKYGVAREWRGSGRTRLRMPSLSLSRVLPERHAASQMPIGLRR